MAFFQVNFFSAALGFNTDINVFIPTPNTDDVLNNKDTDYFLPDAKFQVLYLLHGAYGDCTDWFRLTSIEKYATLHKLAVVMPSAANSYYQDMFRGGNYFTYLTEELPMFVEKMFPISSRREDTFVAGLSMGGYGALKLALSKPEKFAACASLSGAFDLTTLYQACKSGSLELPFQWKSIFEDPEMLGETDADLFQLLKRQQENGCKIPKIYLTIGTEDFIYFAHQSAIKKLEASGTPFTYEEYPGIHDWDFWDAHIQDVLHWFPLANDTIRLQKGGEQ